MEKLSVKRVVILSCLITIAGLLVSSAPAQTCAGNGTLSGSYRFVATGIGCTTNAQQPHPCPVFPPRQWGSSHLMGAETCRGVTSTM